jgi:hypothetical protein
MAPSAQLHSLIPTKISSSEFAYILGCIKTVRQNKVTVEYTIKVDAGMRDETRSVGTAWQWAYCHRMIIKKPDSTVNI